jgi:hypothetical protein
VPTPHPAFVDELTRKIVTYTGGDVADATRIAAALNTAEDRLPERIADLVLEDVRRQDIRTWTPSQHDRLRRATVRNLSEEWIGVASSEGLRYVSNERAVASAQKAFADAVAVVEPEALAAGLPRALERDKAARFAPALRTLRGIPFEDRLNVRELEALLRTAEWARAEESAGPRALADVDKKLRWMAGDREYEPSSSTREPEQTLRDGNAVDWAQRIRPAFTEALGIADVTENLDVQLPDRFAGRMASGLTTSIAERSGRSEQDVADVLRAAGDTQWRTASRLLVPDDSLRQLDDVPLAEARFFVVDAMRTEFSKAYGNPDEWPESSPEEVGAKIAAAATQAAERLGVQLPDPSGPAVDPGLDDPMRLANAGMERPGQTYRPLTDQETETIAAVTKAAPKQRDFGL